MLKIYAQKCNFRHMSIILEFEFYVGKAALCKVDSNKFVQTHLLFLKYFMELTKFVCIRWDTGVPYALKG